MCFNIEDCKVNVQLEKPLEELVSHANCSSPVVSDRFERQIGNDITYSVQNHPMWTRSPIPDTVNSVKATAEKKQKRCSIVDKISMLRDRNNDDNSSLWWRAALIDDTISSQEDKSAARLKARSRFPGKQVSNTVRKLLFSDSSYISKRANAPTLNRKNKRVSQCAKASLKVRQSNKKTHD